MKKTIIIGAVITALGLLIAFGPQFLFKVCSPETTMNNDDGCGSQEGSCGCGGNSNTTITYPKCYWTGKALIGLGFLISALGLCMIVFNSMQTQLGLLMGVFFSSIVTLFIPHGLIGGCGMMTMMCRRVAFPPITIIGVILLAISAAYAFYIIKTEKK